MNSITLAKSFDDERRAVLLLTGSNASIVFASIY